MRPAYCNMMNLIRFVIVAVSCLPVFCGQAAVAGPLVFPGSESAQTGVLITDASGNRIVASFNTDMALIPASILKTVTCATALTVMRADSVPFCTLAEAVGNIDGNGVLDGDIVVYGNADPTLGSRYFDKRQGLVSEITEALKKRGVRRITGSLRVEIPSGYDGAGLSWEVEDIGEEYGAGLFGFNWRDNVFSFMPENGIVPTPQGDMECIVVDSASHNAVIRGIDSQKVTVYRKKGVRPSSEVVTTMWSPHRYFISELADSLYTAGIVLENGSPVVSPECKEILVRYYSPTNKEILKSLMRRSDNMMAEGMLRASSPLGCSLDSALRLEMSAWRQNAGTSKYVSICDGSGLSRKNRLSPKYFVSVLASMLRSKAASDYVDIFPRCGKEGTVARFLKGTRLEGRAVIKSGSMGGVLCYAGYILGSDRKTVRNIVVVMVNGFFCPAAQVRKAIENYLLKIL